MVEIEDIVIYSGSLEQLNGELSSRNQPARFAHHPNRLVYASSSYKADRYIETWGELDSIHISKGELEARELGFDVSSALDQIRRDIANEGFLGLVECKGSTHLDGVFDVEGIPIVRAA